MNTSDRLACYAQPRLQQTGLRPEGTRRDLPSLIRVEQRSEPKRPAGEAPVSHAKREEELGQERRSFEVKARSQGERRQGQAGGSSGRVRRGTANHNWS